MSTGRLHGFESLEEDQLLVALDFAGDLLEVLSQPLRIRFRTAEKWRIHTPDFFAVTRVGTWLIDVRPRDLIESEDLESFAAAEDVALVCGWHYAVAAEWRPHVRSTLGALYGRRRPTRDVLDIQADLLAHAEEGLTFGELAAAQTYWPVARPVAAPVVASQARDRPCSVVDGQFAGGAGGGCLMMGAAALDLSPGAGVVLDEVEWLLERQKPHLGRGPPGACGRVSVSGSSGERARTSMSPALAMTAAILSRARTTALV
ncbi:hypothetical protein [Streptomyces sp. WM6368]|uniref:hypothetical protein n=1 Tax=Streptomyces sp. WM6368 TaxID=1415554 RepID=UPI000AFC28BE|nr:hypothetical protein [Streptomyces sp. WM6368]